MKKTICCLICLIVIVNFLSSCTSDTVDLDKDTLEWSYYNSPVEGYVKVECYEQSEHEYRIAYLDLGNDTCSVLGFSGNLPKVLSIPLTTSDGKAIIEISNRAFSLDPLENVHEIHFSDNIRKINKGAFNSPHDLKIIKFGNGLEYIDMNDFVNSPLEKIVFNENEFYKLENHTFFVDKRNNTLVKGLSDDNIPTYIEHIGNCAFSMTDIEDIVIPDGVLSIGNDAFDGCKLLKSIVFPNTLVSIGKSAFTYCELLTTLDLPVSVTSIDESVFSGAEFHKSNLQYVNGGSFTTIPQYAFYNTSLQEYYISKQIKKIEKVAFGKCKSLSYVYIPETVQVIEEYAFSELNNCVIVCEAVSKPIGWCDEWCADNENVTVIFGIDSNNT